MDILKILNLPLITGHDGEIHCYKEDTSKCSYYEEGLLFAEMTGIFTVKDVINKIIEHIQDYHPEELT